MNTPRNIFGRFSSAAAIAVIVVASACGTEQAPPQAPAQEISVERHWPAKHMNRPTPAGSGDEPQTVVEHVHSFMRGEGRPSSSY
jgi:hypothetical protein